MVMDFLKGMIWAGALAVWLWGLGVAWSRSWIAFVLVLFTGPVGACVYLFLSVPGHLGAINGPRTPSAG